MATAAPARVESTTVALEPAQFGLLSAATSVVPIEDPHVNNGVLVEVSPQGTTVGYDPNDCAASPTPDRTLDDGVPFAEYAPIRVFGGFKCRSVGMDDEKLRTRAAGVLAAGELPAVERGLWNRLGAESLITRATVLQTDAVSLRLGVGLLEEWFWNRYGGTPVIHAPRRVATVAADHQLLRTNGSRATTPTGARWSLGGYPTSGPDGTATAGQVWLVASGQITVRRGDVRVYGANMQQALDRRTNETVAIATRTYVVDYDDIAAAIPVTLS